MRLQGESLRAIARKLGRPACTISRELRRNGCATDGHTSHAAMALHAAPRAAARPARKLGKRSVNWAVVVAQLSWQWSPQQIAATIKRVFPDEPERHVSHETIYTAIYAQPRGELRREFIVCLRQGRSTHKPRSRGTDRRGQLPEMLSIHVRPPEVDDRVMPGHWEGTSSRARATSPASACSSSARAAWCCSRACKTPAPALEGFTRKLNTIAAPMRHSLTYDQGKEMARHTELSANTGVRVYFCDPHSPWQRGTCENTNGLLRQYLPKGTDLSQYAQQELDAIADRLNTRPRAVHDWRTPLEVFTQTLANSHQPSQAIH